MDFNATKAEHKLIAIIAERASGELQLRDRVSTMMDLTAVHSNNIKLDFKKLASADSFNFAHDVCGIIKNLDRNTGKLMNFFRPRCAVRESRG